ncbi:MAG: DUF4974 domain-containing protein [Bacteroidales bacterium]|jgi:ferric-dicitrate binding protein FerR (iron transport regulator)|nr:DUF4974 domain-containing protein [Bacteroidales bacterium]
MKQIKYITTNKMDTILARYFSGEASKRDLQKLDQWLAESNENEDYFNQMSVLYQQTALMPPMTDTDMQEGLSLYKKYMQCSEIVPKRKRRFRHILLYGAVAASVAILIAVFSLQYHHAGHVIQVVADNETQHYHISKHINVELTAGSQIQYSSDEKYKIVLSGNATFTVNAKESEKLLVQAGETYIQDIGTVFTVMASNPKELIEVEVKQGEVIFYTITDKGIHIKENEKGCYNPQTKQFSFIQNFSQEETGIELEKDIIPEINKNLSQKPTYISATDAVTKDLTETETEIEFNTVYLYQVVDNLKTRYGVDIVFEDNSLGLMQITASFDKNETVDNVLQIIAETLSINILRNENTFVISK